MIIIERCVGGSLDGKMPPRGCVIEGTKAFKLMAPPFGSWEDYDPITHLAATVVASTETYIAVRYDRAGPGWRNNYVYYRIWTMLEPEAIERIEKLHREKYPQEFDD